MTVFESICAFLNERNVAYRTVHHAPTHTSEESAKARGESVKVGGKAIVAKVDDQFKLFVLSAALKLDSKRIKERFGAKSVRFATPDELLSLTGLVPGSVPPLGRPILDLDLYIDGSIDRNDRIAFNAGSLTDSIVMPVTEYRRVCGGDGFDFSQS